MACEASGTVTRRHRSSGISSTVTEVNVVTPRICTVQNRNEIGRVGRGMQNVAREMNA